MREGEYVALLERFVGLAIATTVLNRLAAEWAAVLERQVREGTAKQLLRDKDLALS